jgi:broad specificity phosphatase PhoE
VQLVLVRHARVSPEPGKPLRLWGLSEHGRRAAEALGQREALRTVRVIASSPESKAAQTAAAFANGRPIVEVADLGELDRSAAGFIATEAERLGLVRAILEQPDVSIRGCEAASDARNRFVRAIDGLVADNPRGGLAVVAHGTVLSLYMAHLRGLATADFEAWRRIRLPDLAVVDPIRGTVISDFGS